MKKNTNGMSSFQEYNQFKTRIFDAIDEWQNYFDGESSYGLSVNPATLLVEIVKHPDNGFEWYPFETFLKNGEVSGDAVLDIADQYCFVR